LESIQSSQSADGGAEFDRKRQEVERWIPESYVFFLALNIINHNKTLLPAHEWLSYEESHRSDWHTGAWSGRNDWLIVFWDLSLSPSLSMLGNLRGRTRRIRTQIRLRGMVYSWTWGGDHKHFVELETAFSAFKWLI